MYSERSVRPRRCRLHRSRDISIGNLARPLRKSIGSRARASVSAVTRGAYKNRSYLRRPLRAGQEKSCQIAALGSRNVPICARIAYGFHLGPRIARRASIRGALLPPFLASPRHAEEKSPRHGCYVRIPRGFRTVSISQTNRAAARPRFTR